MSHSDWYISSYLGRYAYYYLADHFNSYWYDIVACNSGYNCDVMMYAMVLYFLASFVGDAGGSWLEICKLAIMAFKVSASIIVGSEMI